MVSLKDSSLLSRNKVVSSANCAGSTPLSFTLIPFSFVLWRSNEDNISAQIKNKYGEHRSPCLTPFHRFVCQSSHNIDRLEKYMYLHPCKNNITQLLTSEPELNKSSVFCKKDHAALSNVFSKSIISNRPGIFFSQCIQVYHTVV